MRRFFIERNRISDSTAVLTGSDARHLRNVLRLKPGDEIGLFDGEGFECQARILTVSPGRVTAKVIRTFPAANEPTLYITLAQGFLKERKMDALVRQTTELGICRWVPYIAERSIPRPKGDRFESRKKRWEKISREAAKQCRRSRVPEICDLLSFEKMLALGEGVDLKIIFWENETEPLHRSCFSELRENFPQALVVLGPEGGLTDQEVAKAKSCDFVTAALGPRILRADTATVAACAIVQYLFGDLGK